MELHIHKAQGFGDKGVEPAKIVIEEEIQDFKTLEAADTQYKLDAAYLCDVLHDTLPGGTFDRLLVAMLECKVSHFKVSHKE